VCELRRTHPRWGPRRVVHALRRLGITPVPSRSTVYRVLVRHGLVTAIARKRRREDYRRWERSGPMQLWQLDVMGPHHPTDPEPHPTRPPPRRPHARTGSTTRSAAYPSATHRVLPRRHPKSSANASKSDCATPGRLSPSKSTRPPCASTTSDHLIKTFPAPAARKSTDTRPTVTPPTTTG
jgi:hypothetical protein